MKNSVQAPQEHAVDMEEIGHEDRLRLGVQERPPGLPDRRGAGSMPTSLRICHAVDGANLLPGTQLRQLRPVGPQQPRVLDLALEHGQLMAQDEDFGVLGAVGPGKQGKPAEHAQARQTRRWIS